MTFDRMKEIREENDVKQIELCHIMNVSPSTYSGWENGIDPIPLLRLNEFCNYFDVSLDYVCNLNNNKSYTIKSKEINIKLLGKRLQIVRKENKNTQTEAAKIMNLAQSNYSRYEKGKINMPLYPLIQFSKYYKVSLDWLCGKIK